MEIGAWQRRRARASGPDAEPEADRPSEAIPRIPRIRLEAGGGEWLVVVEDIDRSRYERMLGDIIGVLGAERCRYGSWSDSQESGVAPSQATSSMIATPNSSGSDAR